MYGGVSQDQNASMGACVVLVRPCWDAKHRAASDGEILTYLMVRLWIRVCFSKDMRIALPSPVPVYHLSSKVGNVAIVEAVVILDLSGSLLWAGMKRRIEVWLLRRREILPYLLRRPESVQTDCPNLSNLTGQFRSQKGQVGGHLAVVCQPHQIPVDKNGKIVSSGMCLAPVANEDSRNKFS